jgi:hypothetical protein
MARHLMSGQLLEQKEMRKTAQGFPVQALHQFGSQSAAQDHRDRVDVGLLAGTPKLSPT